MAANDGAREGSKGEGMSEQKPGFDISKMTTASKILLAGGVLYFIDLFLQWNRACAEAGVLGSFCVGVSGWHGFFGILNGLLALIIIVMEAVILANLEINVGTPEMRSRVDAGIAWVLLVSTLIKVLLVDNDFISWPAWVGIVLAVVIAYGGWMRWQEAGVVKSPGGGMTE
jgi:hypothetical protein